MMATLKGGLFNPEQEGMSMRQYYAAHAPEMPAWFLADAQRSRPSYLLSNLYFEWRWAYADMMLKMEGME